MEGYSEFALSDEEKERGLILACRAVPWEDCEVAWLEEDDLIVHPRRLLDCEVDRRSTTPRTTSSACGWRSSRAGRSTSPPASSPR